MKILIKICIVGLIFTGCRKENDCHAYALLNVFVGFPAPGINTFTIRKFAQNQNFQNVIDSLVVNNNVGNPWPVSHDTTYVPLRGSGYGVKAGYDWQIFIPSYNRTVSISEIVEKKNTKSCDYGILASNKSSCECRNGIYSLKQDNIHIIFPEPDIDGPSIIINY